MKRSRKSNRVTWAPGLNLCQVRLFLTEDCPSKVGTQTQDHLQKRTSRMVHPLSVKEFDDLPPGFEGSHCLNPLKEESSYIPRIEWKCPPKVVMNRSWDVAAGEESQETQTQKFREMRVLEAVFPRPSAIPLSPSISLDIEGEYYDDSLTPIVPLTPIEEEIAADIPSGLSAPQNTCLYSQSPTISQDLLSSGICNTPVLQPSTRIKPVLGTLPEADLITAASAAAAVLKKSMEGSLIDTDLLVKIFSDPKMIEKLMNDSQVPTSKPATNLVPPSMPTPPATSAQTPVDRNMCGPGGLQPASIPVSGSIPSPCHESTSYKVSMPGNGSANSSLGEVHPTVNRMLQQPATVSLPRPESFTELVHKPAVSNFFSMPDQVQSSVSSMITQPITAPKILVESKPNLVPPSLHTMAEQPKPNGAPKSNILTMETHPVKDMNYIKNLIREHGSEKKELGNRNMSYNGSQTNHIQNLEISQNVGQKEMRSKFQKPCMYYRSPRGCRNGSSCPYQHDFAFQFHSNSGALEAPVAKRMRFGGEITGST